MINRPPYMCARLLFLIGVLVLLNSGAGVAGGPSQIAKGSAVLWDNSHVISYRRDRGNLGPIPEPEVQGYIDQAFATWSQVDTADLHFTATSLGEDVTTSVRFLALQRDPNAGNVVVLDNVGGIVENLFGKENRDKILGFASPQLQGPHIGRFVALMNGALATNRDTVKSTLVHEFGHAIGLDHSQINATLALDGDAANDQFIPTMFPTASDDDSAFVSLNPDDKAWVSRLYPSSSFKTKFGSISGRLIRAGHGPILGANIIAIAVINGADDLMERYSCVSDFLKTNDGSFELFLPPGQYKLRIEPIRIDFVNGSSVGPYSDSVSGQSFKTRVRPQTLAALHPVTAGAQTSIGEITIP